MLLPPDSTCLLYNSLKSSWPRAFFATSGDPTLGLLLKVLQAIVNEAGVVLDSLGHNVDLESEMQAGSYQFKPVDAEIGFSWKRGPEGSNQARAPAENQGWGGNSEASGASGTQSELREDLLIRDGLCVISEERLTQAAHLVPKNRTDIYKESMGNDFSGVYQSYAALLLSPNLHSLYDRFRWSFYCKVEQDETKIIFHAFDVTGSPTLKQYHGKEIPRSSFRLFAASPRITLPDTRLMDWHYQQCCIMRIRGFSFDMSVNAR